MADDKKHPLHDLKNPFQKQPHDKNVVTSTVPEDKFPAESKEKATIAPEEAARDSHPADQHPVGRETIQSAPMQNLIKQAMENNEKLSAEKEKEKAHLEAKSTAAEKKEPGGQVVHEGTAEQMGAAFTVAVNSVSVNPTVLNRIAQVLKDSGADSMSQIKALNQIKEILEADAEVANPSRFAALKFDK